MTSKITIKGVLIGVIALASFAPWAYRWSGQADREFPDTLREATFPAAAEPICAAGVTDLPNALAARDHVQRGEQIRQGTAQLQEMLNELQPLVDGNPRDIAITKEWLDDWQLYLENRLNYADRITADENAVFYLTDIEGREGLEKRITRFAKTNLMASCSTPGDVG